MSGHTLYSGSCPDPEPCQRNHVGMLSDVAELDDGNDTLGSASADTQLSPEHRPAPNDLQQREQKELVRARLFGKPHELVIGRYRVTGRLGSGGMGTVYAASDDSLERTIAIKVVPTDPQGTSRERTLREARALAKLSHPNVVQVYEVGETGSDVYVAMEALAGPTLRSWLEQRRTWTEVLDAYLAAGEGLAAAHAQGIVHRDFKPHNAMFGVDGRVRVLDFGLARLDANEVARAIPDGPLEGEALTMTGTVIGTPAYMAPEQLVGRPADIRSDQFSFCVSLFEALYGKRPFEGRTLAELRAALAQGRIPAPSRDSKVPKAIHGVLVRGLARAPEQRWPSMVELLTALRRAATLRRRRALGLLGVVMSAGVGVLAWPRAEPVQDPSALLQPRCSDAADQIGEVWNDEVRARVLARFSDDGLRIVENMVPMLNRRAGAWVIIYKESCTSFATGQQGEWVHQRRQECLHEVLASFSDTVARLELVEPDNIDELVSLYRALDEQPSAERCTSAEEPRRPESTWIEHEVIATDTMGSIVQRYQVLPQDIRRWNGLADDEPPIVGQRLRLEVRDPAPLPRQRIQYFVRPGQTWADVATSFGQNERSLRLVNPQIDRELAEEDMLVIWHDPVVPIRREIELAPLGEVEGGRSVGPPNDGRLEQATQLPFDDTLYLIRDPQLAWCSSTVASYLPWAIAGMRARYEFRGDIVIADISQQAGGPLGTHRGGHQSGRDVDVWLPTLPGVLDREQLARARNPHPDEVDWFAVYGLIELLDESASVESVSLEWSLQARVHAAGRLLGASDERLARLLTWPRPRQEIEPGLHFVRHADNQIGQLHIRFACGPRDIDCRSPGFSVRGPW